MKRSAIVAACALLLAPIAFGGCGDIVYHRSTQEIIKLIKKEAGLEVPSYATDIRSYDASGIDMALGLKFKVPRANLDHFIEDHSGFALEDFEADRPEFERSTPRWWAPPSRCTMASKAIDKYRRVSFRIRIEKKGQDAVIYAEYWDS